MRQIAYIKGKGFALQLRYNLLKKIEKLYECKESDLIRDLSMTELLLLLVTNLYTGYFYNYTIFTLGTHIYCYHRTPVEINLKYEKNLYFKKERKTQTTVIAS